MPGTNMRMRLCEDSNMRSQKQLVQADVHGITVINLKRVEHHVLDTSMRGGTRRYCHPRVPPRLQSLCSCSRQARPCTRCTGRPQGRPMIQVTTKRVSLVKGDSGRAKP
eukprot:349894-Chlamydomonas_euryale.AAC.9